MKVTNYNRNYVYRNYFFLVLLFISQGLVAQKVFVSPDISDEFAFQEQLPCMIVMQKQWKSPRFIQHWTKEDKGQFVFENLQNFAKNDQQAIISFLEKEHISYQSFYVFNGLQAILNKTQVESIKKISGIQAILLDEASQLQVIDRGNAVQRAEITWGIQQIQADKVWELGMLGKDVVVAGQDTGYDFDNPFIVNSYRGKDGETFDHNYNWHDAVHSLSPLNYDPDDNPMNNPCGLDSEIPCDDHSHGTHTMGTMVGDDPEIKIGIAPEAQWIGCRNMDRGWGSPSTYTECFEWFLAPTNLNGEFPDPSKSPHVIANSWGCPLIEGCNENNWSFMEIVVDNLVAAGVVVVVSAGNDGSQGCSSINRPAAMFESSFVVGASNKVDSVAGFSSYGPVTVDGSGRWKPDVVAPGVDVKSITLDGFGNWQGTSMAGPHVAGAVALMIDANPQLAGQVEEIERILKETAVPVKDERACGGIVADQVPNFIAGYGRIDALAAVNEATVWTNIVQEEIQAFQLYPNPSSDFLSIAAENRFQAEGVIQSFNMLGQLIWEKAFDTGYIHEDISAWAPGSYLIIHKTDKKKTELGKFIKL